MSSSIPLNQLLPGEEAVLINLSGTEQARRLAELGFLPGTRITCILRKKKRRKLLPLTCGAP